MKPTANSIEMIDFMQQAAFLVENGVVIKINQAAANLNIQIGTPISELIILGADDYKTYKSGKLYLELRYGRAWVSNSNDTHLFCIENNFSLPELRALALAGQNLRLPLSNAMFTANSMLHSDAIQQNTELRQQLGMINRSLYQMIRDVCNMTDAAQINGSQNLKFEICDVAPVIEEILEKAATLTECTHKELVFKNLKGNIRCLIDVQLLERAILNLISNAIKFSPTDSVIEIALKHNNNRLALSVKNDVPAGQDSISGNEFSRFLREPGFENSQFGIGLGMSVICSVAAAHKGTVLLNISRKKTAIVTLSIPIRTESDTILKSPEVILGGYSGGIDTHLIELSGILPSSYYEI